MAPRPDDSSWMSAAFLAASVLPSTAMPICASARAGASLTPSPVIPQMYPMFFRASTHSRLSLGSTWAKPSASSMSLSRTCPAGHSAVFG